MPEPDFNRIRKTVAHQEPDRVPLVEILVEYPIISRWLGREVASEDLLGQVDFWYNAGYDYVPLVVGMMTPGKVTSDSAISRVIRERLRQEGKLGDEKSWNLEYTSFIQCRDDFERFPWDVAAQIKTAHVESIKAILPPGMKVIILSGKIYTLSCMLMGFEEFSMSLACEDGLAADVMRMVAEIQSNALESVLLMDHVGAAWAVDDIAATNTTMLSPEMLRKWLFPWYERIAANCHAAGKLFFYHTDGNIYPVIEDMIALGVDGIHPIDPTALDIREFKKRYGDRICLLGNTPTELLRSGTVEDVQTYVKGLIRDVAPGGGFCLGSGNSVPEWANLDNYNAMRETGLEFGGYPIRVD